ncbi:MAG: hypothetical protein LLG04_09695, partial [Parachlamydia sp.]|nr:hypothetical protein [Parachlamydia sp.]
MGAPVAAQIKSVVGADLYNAMQRLGPVEGKMGVRVVKHLENLINRFIELFKTGRWSTEAQICIRMDRDIKQMIKVLEEDDKKLAEHPNVKEAEGDLKFREAVGLRAEKMLAIMQRLAERQPKVSPTKEFKELVNDFAKFKQINDKGIAHDFEILGQKAPVKKGVEISPEEKKQMRAARAEAHAQLRVVEEPQIKKGFEKRHKEADAKFEGEIAAGVHRGKTEDLLRGEIKRKGETLSQQKAGIALAGLIPRLLEQAYKQGIDKHLSDQENEQLQSLTREKLNRLDLLQVPDTSREVLKLINRAFFNKGSQVPPELKKEFEAIREQISKIEKRATLVEPKPIEPKVAIRSVEPDVKVGRAEVGGKREVRKAALKASRRLRDVEISPERKEKLEKGKAAIKERAKLLEAEIKGSPQRREKLEAARSLARNIPIVIKDAYEYVHGKEKVPILAKNLSENERKGLRDLARRTDFTELSTF